MTHPDVDPRAAAELAGAPPNPPPASSRTRHAVARVVRPVLAKVGEQAAASLRSELDATRAELVAVRDDLARTRAELTAEIELLRAEREGSARD